MTCPSDLLAAKVLADAGQLAGEFVQEVQPPWGLWWRGKRTPEPSAATGGGFAGFLGKIGGMLRGSAVVPEDVWKPGEPRGPIRKAGWVDVFRNSVLTQDTMRRTGDVLIIRTLDRRLFFEIIRRHYLLQQGSIDFAILDGGTVGALAGLATGGTPTDPVRLVRIRKPSRWALEQLSLPHGTILDWYNQVPGQEGLFIETGYTLFDPANGLRLSTFRFLENSVLLVNRDGAITSLAPAWRHAASLIEVRCAPPDRPQPEETEKIVIEPALRETGEKGLAILWKVGQPARLQAIIAAESMKRLSGYSAWFGKDGTLWVLATSEHADRGFASILSDVFPSFVRFEEHMFVPAGKTLTPRLSADALRRIFQCSGQDWLCFEAGKIANKESVSYSGHEREKISARVSTPDSVQESENDSPHDSKRDSPDDSAHGTDKDPLTEMKVTLLPNQQLRPMDFFLTFRAEQAVETLEGYESRWTFDFSDVKKKRLILELEIPDKQAVALGLLELSGDGQVGENTGPAAPRRAQPRYKGASLTELQAYTDSGKGEMRARIREIDAALFGKIEQPVLWLERAELSLRLNARLSATVGRMTAAILADDQAAFLAAIHAWAALFPEFAALNRDEVSARVRGELLAAIRRKEVEAETQYGLLLAFAEQFTDSDMFRQAVDSMRTGYSAERRNFHEFSEHEGITAAETGSGGKLSLMGENNLPRIRINVNRFLQLISCGPGSSLSPVVQRQFHLLLRTHLPEEIARKLVSYPEQLSKPASTPYPYQKKATATTHASVYDTKVADLDAWPELPEKEKRDESTLRWYNLLTMDRLKEASLQDFFTGSLYRPAIFFQRETPTRDGEIECIPWMANLPLSELPGISDGKPIARAIFNRFSEGYADWGEYFSLASRAREGVAEVAGLARSQRILLLLVSDYGAMADFRKFILPLNFEHEQHQKWDIHLLILYCDLYRLYMAYHLPLNDQRLFEMLLAHIPVPPNGWEDFRGAAEWVVMCLFLSNSPKRRFQLDELLNRAILWLGYAANSGDETMMDEILTILSFLEIGVLADLIPERLEQHQFKERRRAVWLEHARTLACGGASAFDYWLKTCRGPAPTSSAKG